MRGIEYVYYKDELMIGDKNDEEERQGRVGKDNPQENAHGRDDLLPALRTGGRTRVFHTREAKQYSAAVHSKAEDAAHDGAVEDAAVLRRDVHRATDCLSEFCIAGEFPPMRKEVRTLVRYDMDGENNRRTFVMMQFFPSSLRLTDRNF